LPWGEEGTNGGGGGSGSGDGSGGEGGGGSGALDVGRPHEDEGGFGGGLATVGVNAREGYRLQVLCGYGYRNRMEPTELRIMIMITPARHRTFSMTASVLFVRCISFPTPDSTVQYSTEQKPRTKRRGKRKPSASPPFPLLSSVLTIPDHRLRPLDALPAAAAITAAADDAEPVHGGLDDGHDDV